VVIAKNWVAAHQLALPSRAWDGIANTVAIGALLALSLGTTLPTSGNGWVVLAWAALWGIAAALVGWRRRTWRWVARCPLTMLALVLLWELVYGPASWASLYVMLLGIVFTVAASLGALLGTWWGKHR
jgi:hypothetical protein